MTRSIFQPGQLCSRSRLRFEAALAISAEAGKLLSTAYKRRRGTPEHSLPRALTFKVLNTNPATFGGFVLVTGRLFLQIASSWQCLRQPSFDYSRRGLERVLDGRYKTWSLFKLRVSTLVSVDYHINRRHSRSVWTALCIFRSIRDGQDSAPSTQWLCTPRSICLVALKPTHRKTVVKSKHI